MTGHEHTPVLAQEVVRALNIQSDGTYVDATFGRGGHTRAILAKLGEHGRVLAIDRDPDAVASGQNEFSTDPRINVVHARFSRMAEIVAQYGDTHPVMGIVFDLGVSSPQLDAARRGFSFRHDGPLDMRMDPGYGVSVAEWLQSVDENELARVIRSFGEERFAKRVARAILLRQQEQPLSTTRQLAEVVAAAVPTREPGQHPATRTFQALRLHVNDELEEISAALPQAMDCLSPGGRLVVISFHSLEDRIVKRFIRDASRADPYPVDLPIRASELRPSLQAIGRAIKASKTEVEQNPRARSAVLRVAEKLETQHE